MSRKVLRGEYAEGPTKTMNEVIRLRAGSSLGVLYSDRTSFGGPLGTHADAVARRVFIRIIELVRREGAGIRMSRKLLDEIRSSEPFRAVAMPRSGAWILRESFLHPPRSKNRPAFISSVDQAGFQQRAAFPPSDRHEFLAAVSVLSNRGFHRAELTGLGTQIRALIETWMLTGVAHREVAPTGPAAALLQSDVTFVGHNTVVIRDGKTAIMFDPYLHEVSSEYPTTYQPLQLHELGHLDAVVLTHSHRDHFDPASLLRFDPATTIYVPAVERESILTIDMQYRLLELGFEDVRALNWGDVVSVGGIRLRALPFYGEQPTDADWLHPEVRNHGCTYIVETDKWSGAILADSGRDNLGNVKELAMKCRREFGPLDVVFSGYRGWNSYAAQLLGSSVARYALFVPPDYWGARMQLMSSIDDALDVAERWGARYLCPYGDGGAPWHWNSSLGPRLDADRAEVDGFDPFPERVAHAAARRTVSGDGVSVPSPVRVLLLRPGDSLAKLRAHSGPELIRIEGHIWPFDESGLLVSS